MKKSQLILKTLAIIELIIASLLLCAVLWLLYLLMFTEPLGHHGHGYVIFTLILFVPTMIGLFVLGYLLWRYPNNILVWWLHFLMALLIFIGGLVIW